MQLSEIFSNKIRNACDFFNNREIILYDTSCNYYLVADKDNRICQISLIDYLDNMYFKF